MSQILNLLFRRTPRTAFLRRDALPLSMLELESRVVLSTSPWGPEAPSWAQLASSGVTFLEDVPATATGTATQLQLTDFEPVTIDRSTMADRLSEAPLGVTRATVMSPITLSLPTPSGSVARFAVWEVTTMEPGLAAQFPDIHTYRGQGIDDPTASLAADITPLGFHASVMSANGAWSIDPYYHLDDSVYAVYAVDHLVPSQNAGWESESDEEDPEVSSKSFLAGARSPSGNNEPPPSLTSNGGTLRTFRLAVAATGEFTQLVGGTSALAQATIVSVINRVNQIYENDLSIHFNLVNNNEQVVYTNPATDPYTGNNLSSMLGQNVIALDAVIGNGNYDVGHVFTGIDIGGLATLGVVGNNAQKARGSSSTGNPFFDAFSVRVVCHELGHQFGATHTFNGVGSGLDGNRDAGTAYEPGGGSTIMSYGGGNINADNIVTSNIDPYFHYSSLNQITNHLANNPGVGTTTATGNAIPTAFAGFSRVVPANTPFALPGSGTDSNGDPLTYTWEEMDLGPAVTLGSPDNGSSPLYRSVLPSTNATRSFPRLSTVLAGQAGSKDEVAAGLGFATTRTVNFRLTVRDNHPGAGAYNSSALAVQVYNTGFPFSVAGLDVPTTIGGGSAYNLLWNVSGTTGNGINTSQVIVDFSSDGGLTFSPITAETPNDGSQVVTIPNVATNQGRFRVRAVNNYFYDINNANIEVAFTPSALTVENTADSGPGSLRQAILDANALPNSQTIVFSPLFNTPQTITLTSGELQITGHTTINGPGPNLLTISGNHASRVFNTSGGPANTNIAIHGMQIRDARTTSMGGAVVVGDENLDLFDFYIHDSESTSLGGGAIAVIAGGNLYLERSTLSGNKAAYGGAISFYNGGGTVWLEQCTVSGNSAATNGGALYFSVAPGVRNITVRASTITGNTANMGGGIYIGSGNVPLTAITTVLSGNTALSGVAPDIRSIYTTAPQMTAISCALGVVDGVTITGSGNLTYGLNLLLRPLADNGGLVPTIAMAVSSPLVNAGYNPGLAKWDARGEGFARDVGQTDIGAFEIQPYSAPVDSLADGDDGNYAQGQFTLREAIAFANHNAGVSDTITFSSLFNTPQTIVLGSQLTIKDAVTINGPGASLLTISGNSTNRILNTEFAPIGAAISVSGLTLTKGSNGLAGGAVYVGDENLTLTDCVVIGNSAARGGGVYVNGTTAALLSLNRTTVSGNTANTNGGGIYFYDSGSLAVSNSTIANNKAGNIGGGVYFFGSGGFAGLNINNSTFSGNSAANAGGAFGLQSFNAILDVRNTTIINNTAGSTGGGISRVSGNGSFILTSSIVSGNSSGNAVSPSPDIFTAGAVTANNNAIGSPGGWALSSGGGNLPYGLDLKLGILANNGGPTLTHLPAADSPLVNAGSNPSGFTLDQRGQYRSVNAGTDIGAVERQQDFIVRTDKSTGPGSLAVVLSDANAIPGRDVITFDPAYFNAESPRTIVLASELPVTEAVTINGPGANLLTVSGNKASRVFNLNAPGIFAPISIQGLTIANGSAPNGGGILLSDDELTLTGVAVENNTATSTDGGGIYVSGGGRLIVGESTLSGNQAAYGGAIDFFNGGGGSLTVSNSTLSGNTATARGGALYFQGAYGAGINIRNSTITANSAGEGGGFFRDGTALTPFTVDSTIVSGNPAGNNSDITSAGTVTANASAFGSLNGFALSGANNLVAASLNLGPLQFHGGPTRTHALGAGSAAINAGTNLAGLATDQRGFARSIGQTDIGAYEVQPAPVVTGVAINQGEIQRSRVTRLDVTFNTAVSLGANALVLSGPNTPNVAIATTLVNNATVATLTFSGAGTESGSLIDGLWTLTINAAAITNADGVAMGANVVTTFKRLFGDADGNATVDANDFGTLGNFFGKYAPAFDNDGNLTVDAGDLAAFGNRFGMTL